VEQVCSEAMGRRRRRESAPLAWFVWVCYYGIEVQVWLLQQQVVVWYVMREVVGMIMMPHLSHHPWRYV